VDDVIVHKLGENDYLLVINAGTRKRLEIGIGRCVALQLPSKEVSDYYTQLAIQGPKAVDVMRKLTDVDLDSIKKLLGSSTATVCGIPNTMWRAPAIRRRRFRDLCPL